jgi:two-component system OmpR family sensor kinase
MPIRFRLAGLFTLIATVATALGGWFLVLELQHGLVASLDENISTQWTQIRQAIGSTVGQVNFQDSGGSAVGAGRTGTHSSLPPLTEYIVQLIGGHSHLVDSNQAAGTVALLTPRQVLRAEHRAFALTTLTAENERIRVFAGPAATTSPQVLIVGASLDTITGSVAAVRRDLLIGGLIIVIAIMFGSYALAVTALTPVERLRRQAEKLSSQDANLSLPVPQTNDEIAALARTMNLLLERLHLALTRQRSFVADAGHELRTPFAILQGELELAARPGRSRSELEGVIGRAADETSRLSRLAEDLLFLARSDEAVTPLTQTKVPIRKVLEQSVSAMNSRAAIASVTFAFLGDLDAVVLLDEDRIRQALDNLIDNALRYAPENSEISISTRTVSGVDGEVVMIDVADRGPGFPTEFIPHAFERFHRPDDGRSRSDGGAGLGLAIVASIATSHGGTATACNREGGGAVVSITISKS